MIITRRIATVLLAALIVCGAWAAAIAADNGLVTKPSKYSVGTTIDRLEAALKAAGNTIFARIDHAEQAGKVGLTLRPTQLLIWGNPKGGTPLMTASPTAAIDLPLKFLAWEDEGGKTWLSYNSVEYLRARHAITGMSQDLSLLQSRIDAVADKARE
jgi:uncharacterized protein (DUF302 family)